MHVCTYRWRPCAISSIVSLNANKTSSSNRWRRCAASSTPRRRPRQSTATIFQNSIYFSKVLKIVALPSKFSIRYFTIRPRQSTATFFKSAQHNIHTHTHTHTHTQTCIHTHTHTHSTTFFKVLYTAALPSKYTTVSSPSKHPCKVKLLVKRLVNLLYYSVFPESISFSAST